LKLQYNNREKEKKKKKRIVQHSTPDNPPQPSAIPSGGGYDGSATVRRNEIKKSRSLIQGKSSGQAA
jgi:hypothetical protein